MRFTARLGHLWRGLVGRERMERELDEELSGYFEELVARHEAAGLPREEALRAARRGMGSELPQKASVRESWLASAWDAAAQDLWQAWRGLRATKSATALATVTFALGIGATTAILSVVQATLLTPPPFREPSRLVMVWADLTSAGFKRAPLSGPELQDLRQRTTSFEGIGGVWSNSITLTQAGEPEFVRIGFVTHDFFPVLGVRAAAGRLLQREDETEGAPQTLLLSHALWQRRFGGDPGVVGRSVTVNDRPAIVVGVLPEGFRLLLPHDAGIPDTIEAFQLFPWRVEEGPRGQRFLRVVARMKPGADLVGARHDVDRLAAQLARELPAGQSAPLLTVALASDNTRAVRDPLAAVSAGVAVLLVIAAVNVLGVLVARAAARRREIAVRVALGAGLRRILRLALAEGLSLAALGAVLGVALGAIGLRVLLAVAPEALRRLGAVALDGRAVAASLALAFAWGALFAFAPLREYLRGEPSEALAAARGSTRRTRPRTRSALVVAQVALTLVLLVAALLLARTFAAIQAVDPGFRAAGVLTFRAPSATPRYETQEARDTLARSLQAALRSLPGVTAVGAASHLPFDAIPNWAGPYALAEGEGTEATLPSADYRSLLPGSLEAAGIRLVQGRSFTEADGPSGERVALVDELLAERAWPGRSPLGQRLRVDPGSSGAPDTWVSVVGVVRHVRHRSLLERLNPQVYFPLSQAFRNPVAWLVRGGGDPSELAPAVRAAVRQVDATLPVYELLPLSAYLERAQAVQRFTTILILAFAGAALVLAAIGVYGVIAYLVVERRREFGVRLALGATRAQIGALVLRQGARLTLLGAALGVAGALLSARLLGGLLYGVSPFDPLTYLAALPVLALAALAACVWPARRATRADVLDVLRAE